MILVTKVSLENIYIILEDNHFEKKLDIIIFSYHKISELFIQFVIISMLFQIFFFF